MSTAYTTTTSFLPVGTTPYPSQPECSNPLIQVDHSLIGYHPGYLPAPIKTPAPEMSSCLPEAVTRWWASAPPMRGTATVYSISPLICPSAYQILPHTTTSGTMTLAGCCPRGYQFHGPLQILTGNVTDALTQCVSTATKGQMVEYYTQHEVKGTAGWRKTVLVIHSPTPVFGMPVNGYIADTLATASPTSTSPGDGSELPHQDGETPSKPNAAAIAAGVTVAVAVLLILAFVFWRYRRRIQGGSAGKRNPPGEDIELEPTTTSSIPPRPARSDELLAGPPYESMRPEATASRDALSTLRDTYANHRKALDRRAAEAVDGGRSQRSRVRGS